MAVPSASNAVLESGAQIGAVQIFSGSGSPHNVLTAPKGSFYLRTDSGASTTATRAYINLTGSSTWTNFTTAS